MIIVGICATIHDGGCTTRLDPILVHFGEAVRGILAGGIPTITRQVPSPRIWSVSIFQLHTVGFPGFNMDPGSGSQHIGHVRGALAGQLGSCKYVGNCRIATSLVGHP